MAFSDSRTGTRTGGLMAEEKGAPSPHPVRRQPASNCIEIFQGSDHPLEKNSAVSRHVSEGKKKKKILLVFFFLRSV